MRSALLPFALVLAAIGACTFPDASYIDSGVEGDGSGGSSGSMSSSSSGTGPDASGSSSGGGDGSSSGDASSDRATSGDSRADVSSDSPWSEGGDGPVDCDQDKDGFNGPQCTGGTDCCDTDSNAFPMQTKFFTKQDACQSWDYNCDMMTEYQFQQNIPCTGTPALGCNGGPGFLGAEDCGQMGPYGSCKANGAVACSLQQSGTATQGCQ